MINFLFSLKIFNLWWFYTEAEKTFTFYKRENIFAWWMTQLINWPIFMNCYVFYVLPSELTFNFKWFCFSEMHSFTSSHTLWIQNLHVRCCRFLPLVIQIFKGVATVRTALGNQICLVLYRFVQVVLLLVWVHCVSGHSREGKCSDMHRCTFGHASGMALGVVLSVCVSVQHSSSDWKLLDELSRATMTFFNNPEVNLNLRIQMLFLYVIISS